MNTLIFIKDLLIYLVDKALCNSDDGSEGSMEREENVVQLDWVKTSRMSFEVLGLESISYNLMT